MKQKKNCAPEKKQKISVESFVTQDGKIAQNSNQEHLNLLHDIKFYLHKFLLFFYEQVTNLQKVLIFVLGGRKGC